jgi:hypothetical protein
MDRRVDNFVCCGIGPLQRKASHLAGLSRRWTGRTDTERIAGYIRRCLFCNRSGDGGTAPIKLSMTGLQQGFATSGIGLGVQFAAVPIS